MKQAASRPSPPLPSAASGSTSRKSVEIDAERGERAPRGLGQPHVVEGIEQQPPDQEFDREIIDALLVPPFGVVAFRHPDVDQPVAQRHDGRLIPVMLARLLRRSSPAHRRACSGWRRAIPPRRRKAARKAMACVRVAACRRSSLRSLSAQDFPMAAARPGFHFHSAKRIGTSDWLVFMHRFGTKYTLRLSRIDTAQSRKIGFHRSPPAGVLTIRRGRNRRCRGTTCSTVRRSSSII